MINCEIIDMLLTLTLESRSKSHADISLGPSFLEKLHYIIL